MLPGRETLARLIGIYMAATHGFDRLLRGRHPSAFKEAMAAGYGTQSFDERAHNETVLRRMGYAPDGSRLDGLGHAEAALLRAGYGPDGRKLTSERIKIDGTGTEGRYASSS
jgi:hypothetical protein